MTDILFGDLKFPNLRGEDFGKAISWFTGTAEGAAFGELYNSVYSCDNSFLTYITASSQ